MEKDPIIDNGYNRKRAERVQAICRGLGQIASEPELDGQEYHPSPMLIADTREGYDENGDYHVTVDPDRWQLWLDHTQDIRHGQI